MVTPLLRGHWTLGRGPAAHEKSVGCDQAQNCALIISIRNLPEMPPEKFRAFFSKSIRESIRVFLVGEKSL